MHLMGKSINCPNSRRILNLALKKVITNGFLVELFNHLNHYQMGIIKAELND